MSSGTRGGATLLVEKEKGNNFKVRLSIIVAMHDDI